VSNIRPDGWTDPEVAQLAKAFPEQVRVSPTGVIVPVLSKSEFVALSHRYGNSHFHVAPTPAPTGNAEQDALRARFPTMVPGYKRPGAE